MQSKLRLLSCLRLNFVKIDLGTSQCRRLCGASERSTALGRSSHFGDSVHRRRLQLAKLAKKLRALVCLKTRRWATIYNLLSSNEFIFLKVGICCNILTTFGIRQVFYAFSTFLKRGVLKLYFAYLTMCSDTCLTMQTLLLPLLTLKFICDHDAHKTIHYICTVNKSSVVNCYARVPLPLYMLCECKRPIISRP